MKKDVDKKLRSKKFKISTDSVLEKNMELEEAEISASEDEEDDTRRHQKLLDAVQKLKNQKPTVTQRSEASQHISEFNLTEVGKEKVKLNELVKSLKQTTSHVAIKRQLKKVSQKKVLNIPLNRPQAEKIKRTIAYSKVTAEVSKWDKVVKSNRSADQIIFPLKQPEFRLETTENFAKRFTIKTPLEEEVAKLLGSSEHTLDQEKELTPAEEKALKAMSFEEAQQRHKELQKMRALLSYKEAKERRQSKIKSKKYHRILKKEKMKHLVKEFEELHRSDPDAAKEKLKEMDKQRILERMTLKHKSTGKWAKYQKLRAKYNMESRDSIKQQLELGRTLSEKISLPESLNDTAIEVSTLDEHQREDVRDENLLDMYGAKNNTNGNKAIEDLINEVRQSNVVSHKAPSEVLTMQVDSDSDEEEVVNETLERKKNFEDFEDILNDSAEVSIAHRVLPSIIEEANVVPFTSKADAAPSKKANKAKPRSYPVAKDFECDTELLKSMVPDSITLGAEGLDDHSENRMTIEEAFADEDFISEFRDEKKEVQDRERPKGIDLFLPGWGTWGGTGIKPSRRRKRRFFVKAPVLNRKDDSLGNVIINEEKDKKAAAHQVSEIPFPFNSIQQFQSIIRQPIGNTWNPETSFKSMIAPRVITKAGKIIEPIDADTAILQKEVDKNPKKLLEKQSKIIPVGKRSHQGRFKQTQKRKKMKLK